MEQDIVVKSLMRTIEYENQIPEEYQGFVRKYLSWAFAAGYDHGVGYYGKQNSKPIAYYDMSGNELGKFPNQLIASHKTGFTDRLINRALRSGKKTRAGHYWKYLNASVESLPQTSNYETLPAQIADTDTR